MIVAPPLDAGAVNVIVADALPAVAVPIVGVPGTVAVVVGVVVVAVLELEPPPPQAASTNTESDAVMKWFDDRFARTLDLARSTGLVAK